MRNRTGKFNPLPPNYMDEKNKSVQELRKVVYCLGKNGRIFNTKAVWRKWLLIYKVYEIRYQKIREDVRWILFGENLK